MINLEGEGDNVIRNVEMRAFWGHDDVTSMRAKGGAMSPEHLNRVFLHISDSQYFDLVRKNFEFELGGHKILERWLNERRGAKLSEADIILFNIIVSAVEGIRFLRVKLKTRREVNQELVGEYEEVFNDFLRTEEISVLQKLREISSRPTQEGAAVDYTNGTSLEFDGDYKSLSKFISEIGDLTRQHWEAKD